MKASGRQNAENRIHPSPAAELPLFPGAGHGISFVTDEERYKTLLERFSRRVLGE